MEALADCLNSTDANKKDIDFVEYRVHLISFKILFLRRLYELVFDTNVSLKISGDKTRWIWNIFVAKTCKFLWCIEIELSLFSISWNVDVLNFGMSTLELFHV